MHIKSEQEDVPLRVLTLILVDYNSHIMVYKKNSSHILGGIYPLILVGSILFISQKVGGALLLEGLFY